MLFLCFLTLFGSSIALPSEVSIECAICQLFAYGLVKENTTLNVNAHLVPQSSVTLYCSEIPRCSTSLTHCQILRRIAIERTKYIAIKNDDKIGELLSVISNDTSVCNKDPHAIILDRRKGTTKCTMCILVYHFFEFMNTGIMQMPLLQQIPGIINTTCDALNIINKENTPAVCEALASGSKDAILHAFADSMGSFYNLIAVKTMGCPPYTTLFTVCA